MGATRTGIETELLRRLGRLDVGIAPWKGSTLLAAFVAVAKASRTLIDDVKNKRVDASTSYQRHTELISQELDLLNVADVSELTLDPNARSSHLIVAAFNDLPQVTELLGQVRGKGRAALAATRGGVGHRVQACGWRLRGVACKVGHRACRCPAAAQPESRGEGDPRSITVKGDRRIPVRGDRFRQRWYAHWHRRLDAVLSAKPRCASPIRRAGVRAGGDLEGDRRGTQMHAYSSASGRDNIGVRVPANSVRGLDSPAKCDAFCAPCRTTSEG